MRLSKPQMVALIVLGEGPSGFGPMQDAGSSGTSVNSLVNRGLAVKSKDAKGSQVWRLTDRGHDVLGEKKRMATRLGIDLQSWA